MAVQTATQHPRYFWRRLIAYSIDVSLCWTIVAILFGVFSSETFGEGQTDIKTKVTFGARYELGQFRPPLYIGTETCGVPDEISPDLRSAVAPAIVASAEMCFERELGLPTQGSVRLVLDDAEAAANPVVIPLNFSGNVRFADLITFGLFLLLSIICLRLYKTTPGKRLMGLRVAGTAPPRAIRREVIRNIPNILMVAVIAALTECVNTGLMTFDVVQPIAIGVQVVALCAAVCLWILPLLRWQGAMFHDKWSGLVVLRTIAA